MINVSDEFRRTMEERTDFKCHAEVTLADGQTLTLTEDDFAMGGNRVTDGAGASGLPLGAAVCRTVSLSLSNYDGRLDGYDFFGARIRLWLTFRLSETTERVELGTFTVTEPESRGETVTIAAGDDMALADKPFAPSRTGDMTLGELFRDVCGQCGLHYATAQFPNSDMTVTAPEEEERTCREVLGYIAMLAGGNARIDRRGDVQILTYERAETAPDHDLTGWSQLRVDTDDVLVTGLEMETEAGTVREGESGYVLQVENPLAAGREQEALRHMGDRLLGLRMRKFSGSHVGYPLAECMDTAVFADRRGRRYTSVITDVTFTFAGFTELSNSAEGAVRSGSRYVSGEARAKLEARKLVKKEQTDREAAVRALQKTLDQSGGMYFTAAEQPDGSSVYYLHDKPTLEESMNVVKVTANALGLSTDGGKTYPFGITIDGEMIMGIIQAEGINADWITAGVFQSQPDKSGKRKFYMNAETGDVDLEVRNLTIAGQSVNEALSDAVTGVENQFYLSSSPTGLSGGKWENTQPEWTQGKYIWSRQYVTYGDGTHAYLPSEDGVCITGNTGAAGKNGTNGKDGTNGTNGRGVRSTEVTYKASSSGTTAPGGEWDTSVPSVPAGQYLWTKTVIIYTDDTSSTLYSVGRIGADGANGANGKDGKNGTNGVGIQSISNYYLAWNSSSGVTVQTKGWSTGVQSVSADKPYLWNYEVTAYTDGSSTTVEPHVIGTYGRDGSNGANGKGISDITEHYLATSAASGVTTSTSGWSTTLQNTDTTKRYLWNYETITYTDGSTSTVAPRIIGTHGENGSDGSSAYTHIRYSASADGTGFVSEPTASTKYIGIYTGISKTAPTSKTSYTWSKYMGDNGTNGTNGKDGNGIRSITYYYAATQTQTPPDASKVTATTMPALSETNKYLWQKEVIDFTDASVADKTTVILLAVYGDKGKDGTNGTNGTNGTSVTIKSTSIEYKASGSGTTAPSSGWSASIPSVANGQYLWTKTVVTYSDGTSTTAYAVAYKGTNGANGEDGIGIESVEAEYYTSTSATTPTGGSWSTSIPAVQKDKYIWTRQKITYSDGNVEYAGQYCMTKTVGDIAQQKVDEQTQEDIFNKLTNNGALQGLFMQDGQLYINGQYLRVFDLAATGAKIGGWIIDSHKIYGGAEETGGYTVIGEPWGNYYVFAAGSPDVNDLSKALFRVHRNGKLYATGAEISGNVTVTGGSIDALNVKIAGKYGGLIQGTGMAASGAETTGIVLYGPNGVGSDGRPVPPYIMVSDTGIRGQTKSASGADHSFNMAGNAFEVLGNIFAKAAGTQPGAIEADGTIHSGTQLYSDGDVVAVGNMYAADYLRTSDRRLKKDIEPLGDAYARALDGMTPVRYRYKTDPADGPYRLGYIAQDVKAAMEAAGIEDAGMVGEYTDGDGNARLALAYDELIALLHMKINSLEAEIKQIKEGSK